MPAYLGRDGIGTPNGENIMRSSCGGSTLGATGRVASCDASGDAYCDASRDDCRRASAARSCCRAVSIAIATVSASRRASYARCRHDCEQYRRGVAPRDGVSGFSHESRSHTGAAAGGGKFCSLMGPTVSGPPDRSPLGVGEEVLAPSRISGLHA